jgi:hypothetical protein
MANNTTNYIESCITPEDSEEKVASKILAYSAIFFVAVVGNIRVIVLVLGRPGMRRRTINLFVVNMAISDLLIALFLMPRAMVEIADIPAKWHVEGNLGNALCKLVFFVQDTSIAVSIESLVIIACDRYFALAYPTHAAPTSKRRLLIITMTWIVAFFVHCPYFLTYQLKTFENTTFCIESWSSDIVVHTEMKKTFFYATFSLFVVVPIISLTALYSGILYKLKQQGYLIRSVSIGSNSSKRRREYHVLKMAIAILIGFAVCWVPVNTFIFIFVFIWKFTMPCNLNDLVFFVFFMASANSALNPCIYIYFSRIFQKLSKRNLTKKRVINLGAMQKFCRMKEQI